MKFGFYVSGKASRLSKSMYYMNYRPVHRDLLDDVVFVLSDSFQNDDLKKLCRGRNIFLKEKEYSSKDTRLSDDLLDLMNLQGADYLFVFGTKLLKGELLRQYKFRIINFHPSLLPSFPGLNSIDQAAKYGSLICGNTAHFIDEGIDTGQIIMQGITTMRKSINYEIILDQQILMLIQIMYWLKESRITIKGRGVTVKDANYFFNEFIPNLEISNELIMNKTMTGE